MNRIKDDCYIHIEAFMVNELHLKGNELLIYALLFGFSQAESQKYTGSLQYIADWTQSTKQGVMKNLKSLVAKGFIQKNEVIKNGVKFCEYYATEFHGGIKQSLTGVVNSVSQGIKQSLPNTIDNTIDNTINKNNRVFTPPTVDEVREYCKQRGNRIDAEYFCDYYQRQRWKLSNGINMSDWRAAVRTWERKDRSKKVGANGVALSDEPIDPEFDRLF